MRQHLSGFGYKGLVQDLVDQPYDVLHSGLALHGLPVTLSSFLQFCDLYLLTWGLSLLSCRPTALLGIPTD